METKVSFYSEGYKLAGTLFIPDDLPLGQKSSGVIMCTGFTGTRDRSLLPISRYFCQQGYIVLSLDYRGFGESEGTKWRLIPLAEVEDVRSAITFLQQHPQVEAASIGLFGSSFGGAVAIYTAALDDRVKCVTTNVTVGNGRNWLRSLRNSEEWQAFLEELEEDRVRRALTGTSKMVDWLHIMVPDAESRARSEERLKTDLNSCTELPLETGQAVIDFTPDEVVHKIAPRAILFTVAEREVLTPLELAKELYDRAGEPKKWVVIPGASHYDTYSPPCLQLILDEALAWFKQHIPPGLH